MHTCQIPKSWRGGLNTKFRTTMWVCARVTQDKSRTEIRSFVKISLGIRTIETTIKRKIKKLQKTNDPFGIRRYVRMCVRIVLKELRIFRVGNNDFYSV